MKKTTVKEYDIEGKLIKETVTEEDEAPTIEYPAPIIYPYMPPIYPTVQPQLPWNDGTITITWQKGD
jgi:hypothetical protein